MNFQQWSTTECGIRVRREVPTKTERSDRGVGKQRPGRRISVETARVSERPKRKAGSAFATLRFRKKGAVPIRRNSGSNV